MRPFVQIIIIYVENKEIRLGDDVNLVTDLPRST